MEMEDIILAYIREHPGISARRVASCLDSKTTDLRATEEKKIKASFFKQLRALKKRGNVHNRGDHWYLLNGNIG